MSFKKKGFSLIELLIVIAIFSVLLLITTDRFIIGAVKANNNYNQEIDLQGGVKNSMDNIKNTLKKSVQVHLVGKEVYAPNMDLSKLDKNYNYIAFREDGGNRFLANLVYNKSSKQFDIIPLMAIDKQDNLNNTDINYNLKFYEDDPNYKEKMEKNSLTLTVEGKSKIKGLKDKEANIKDFKLKEDFILPNVNQILISRHLKGGVKDITAIAYDDGLIKPKKKNSISLVFVIDASASMKHSMDNGYLFKHGNDDYRKYTVKDEKENKFLSGPYKLQDINKYKEWTGSDGKPANNASYITRKVLLEYALNEVFLGKLDGKANDNKLDISTYMFTYDHMLQHHQINSPKSDQETYFYELNTLESKGYGPYNLGLGTTNLNKIKAYVTDGLKMKYAEVDHNRVRSGKRVVNYGQGTNTGWGLLQGFEILKQLEARNREDRYLILLTDGDPNYYTSYIDGAGRTVYLTNRKDYNEYANKEKAIERHHDRGQALEYIRLVSNSNYYNSKNLYKTAYVVGFGNESQLERLGITTLTWQVTTKEGKKETKKKAVPFFKKNARNKPVPIFKVDGENLVKNNEAVIDINQNNSKNIFNYLTIPYDEGNPNDYKNPTYNKSKLFNILTDADERNDPYKVFMADDPETLKDALDKIVEDIVQKAGIFDGPDKMAP